MFINLIYVRVFRIPFPHVPCVPRYTNLKPEHAEFHEKNLAINNVYTYNSSIRCMAQRIIYEMTPMSRIF